MRRQLRSLASCAVVSRCTALRCLLVLAVLGGSGIASAAVEVDLVAVQEALEAGEAGQALDELGEAIPGETDFGDDQHERRRAVVAASLRGRALTELDRIWDMQNARPVFIEYTDETGRTVRRSVRPTVFTSGVNMGRVAFKLAIKAGGDFKRAWGIWGDLDNAKKLAETIHTWHNQAGATDQERLNTYTQALAAGISLVDYAEWVTTIDQGGVFRGMGGTIETAASLANGDYMLPEKQVDLVYAFFKDASILASPELAAAYFVYDVAKWGIGKYGAYKVRTELVDLLVENGTWEVPAPQFPCDRRRTRPGDLER